MSNPLSAMSGPTRWETETEPGHSERYVQRMRQMAAEGADLDGEARFVDAVVGRHSRILDAGCGTGRVGAGLHARGHDVVGVDADPVLVAAARADHPGPTWVVDDLAALVLEGDPFDAVVAAGNVMVFLAPGSEKDVLLSLSHHLRDGGALVTGFGTAFDYQVGQFDAEAGAAGLTLEQRFATWDLRPWHAGADWVVSIHRKANSLRLT